MDYFYEVEKNIYIFFMDVQAAIEFRVHMITSEPRAMPWVPLLSMVLYIHTCTHSYLKNQIISGSYHPGVFPQQRGRKSKSIVIYYATNAVLALSFQSILLSWKNFQCLNKIKRALTDLQHAPVPSIACCKVARIALNSVFVSSCHSNKIDHVSY